MTKELQDREIFIPIGRNVQSEVYVEGVACIA